MVVCEYVQGGYHRVVQYSTHAPLAVRKRHKEYDVVGALYTGAATIPAQIDAIAFESFTEIGSILASQARGIFVDIVECLHQQPLVDIGLFAPKEPDGIYPNLYQIGPSGLTEPQVVKHRYVHFSESDQLLLKYRQKKPRTLSVHLHL